MPPSRADGSPLTVPRAPVEPAAVLRQGLGGLSRQPRGSRWRPCGIARVPAAGLDTATVRTPAGWEWECWERNHGGCKIRPCGGGGDATVGGAGSDPVVLMGIPPRRVQDPALRWWQAAASQQVDGERGRTVVSPGCSLPVGRSPAGATTTPASGRGCQGGQEPAVPPQGTHWGLSRGCRQLPFCCPSPPPPCSPATALLFRRGPVPSQHPKALSLLNPHLGRLGSPQSLQEPEATLGSASPWEREENLRGFWGHSHAWEGESPQPWDFKLASLAPVTVGTLVRFQSEQTIGLGRQVRAVVTRPGRRSCKPSMMLGSSEPCGMWYLGCGTRNVVPRMRYPGHGTQGAVPRVRYPGRSTSGRALQPQGGDSGNAVPALVTRPCHVSQVLPDVPSLPEAEQHLRPLPVHLPAHPAAPDQVSPALHLPSRSPAR